MTLRDRIGFDAGGRELDQALERAGELGYSRAVTIEGPSREAIELDGVAWRRCRSR
jgi:hypothetical protein